ncbi:MAG: peptide deformylase [Gemmatimonadota bacterium]|nr:peptide deformylase [Gemmatimonadota bacterium]
MSILDIRVLGDPILRQATTPVGAITADIQRLIDDMFETMYHARGIGLAAPQVGRTERITVLDVDEEPLVLINPEIIQRSSGKSKGEEGCLSIPDIYADVERPKTVTVRATDRNGNVFERDAAELLGRCMQHEIDHLDGKIFLDYLSVLKRAAAIAKWKLIADDYPGNIRRVALETPEDRESHRHSDEEL